MSEIVVYTAEPCSFCARVKGLLESHGLRFTEVNLTKDPEGRAELVRRTGMMSFPQVLIDGELVGGFAETLTAAESGRLGEPSADGADSARTRTSRAPRPPS
ncbi:MAG: glutaredoxin family protein [Solirubrobacterales bacterium]